MSSYASSTHACCIHLKNAKKAYKKHVFLAHSAMQKSSILCKQHPQIIGKDADKQHAYTSETFYYLATLACIHTDAANAECLYDASSAN